MRKIIASGKLGQNRSRRSSGLNRSENPVRVSKTLVSGLKFVVQRRFGRLIVRPGDFSRNKIQLRPAEG